MSPRPRMRLPWLFAAAALTLFSSPVAATYHDLVARATGDSVCLSVMCITATVLNDSTVQYELSANSAPGWMAMGFGSSMIGSPMVIMWANSDGSLTLSQRQATGYQEPKVVSSPPRIATAAKNASSVSGSTIKYAFTIPSDGTTRQNLIWALGLTNPGSTADGATLQQHAYMGTTSLDLSKTLSNDTSTPATPSHDASDDIPLLPYQRLIVAHAIFCVIGFLLLLPAGALLARYMRTFTNVWFKGHWILQAAISGPAIIIGVALGIQAVVKAGAPHLDDDHKKWGVGIFVLYFVQCALGGFIHFVKPSKPKGRPPQNYGHAVLGLLIIALALYQVRTGFKTEWPNATGRGALPNGVNIIWYVWVVLLPVLYAIGLAFLPKQYRQEQESRSRSPQGNYLMDERYED